MGVIDALSGRNNIGKTMNNDNDSSAAPAASEWIEMSQPQHENGNVGAEEFSASSIEKIMEAPLLEGDSPSSSVRYAMEALSRSDEIDDPSSNQHDIDFENFVNNRGLRGVSRAAQSVVNGRAPSPLANNSLNNSTATLPPPPSGGETTTTSNQNTSGGSGDDGASTVLLSIVCILIISPCLVASLAQSIYCMKKRKRDRVDRQVEAVGTNPTSRMLVLSEIFKNDSRPVTEDDASPKKKRVLVKKYRKKTRTERQVADDEETGKRYLENVGSSDWSEEEDDILVAANNDGKRPMIVYVSSFEHLENHDVTVRGDEPLFGQGNEEDDVSSFEHDDVAARVEPLLGQGNQELDIVTASDEKPMTLYVSDSIAHHSSNELPLGQRQPSTADWGENDGTGYACEKSQDAHEGRSDGSELDVERGQKVDANGTGDEGGDNEFPSVNVANYIVCKKDPENDALGSAENLNIVSQDDKDIAPSMPESVAPEHKLGDKTEKSLKTKDGTAADKPQTVSLAPKIPSMPLLDDGVTNRVLEEGASSSSNKSPTDATMSPDSAPDIPPLTIVTAPYPKIYLSPRASLDGKINAVKLPTPRLILPDLNDVEDSDDIVDKELIFRSSSRGSDEDLQSIPEIQGCGSSVTEVTSNVDGLKGAGTGSFEASKLEPLRTATSKDMCAPSSLYPPYQLERAISGASTLSGLGGLIPLKTVGSYRSTASSNVSYFSYDDISIASEESEMCAICLCPYEEGDIRIFSKRCTHAFHKECILEWLVKSHNECPCCRIDMVTKLEIKETSASLIGTERLAQAMAVVNGSEMQEAPPFHGVRRPPRLARRVLARARVAQRRRSGQAHEAGESSMMPPQSPNSPWLWSARFDNGQSNSPSTTGLSPGLSSMPRLDEGGSLPTANNGTDNTHNRDWLWATRFSSVSSNNNNTTEQPTTINPSRSSDAILNPHETNQNNAAAPETAPARGEASMHNTTAGSLFSSTLHNHWQRRTREPQTTRRSSNQQTTIALSPSRLHSQWRRNMSNVNNAVEELPVTVLPAI
mmetsp:Transcript_21746/g.38327  ORF Transcript_21746/g.38327 Transcript_21746/m.38327 type:complete len:1039 (-) Transcript_21746:340-3456(-)